MLIDRLMWDPQNVSHIARHIVTLQEVEEVCAGPFVTRRSYANRLLVVGPTTEGRVLLVVLEPLVIRCTLSSPLTQPVEEKGVGVRRSCNESRISECDRPYS